jgi:hypothetical protein
MRRRRAQRIAAVLAACLVHAVLLAALAVGIPGAPQLPPAPSIEVTLERPIPPPPPPEPKRAPPPERLRPPATGPHPIPAPAPTPLAAGAAPGRINLPSNPEPGEGDDSGNIRRTLRATVGCARQDFFALSPAERVACRKQLKALVGDVPALSGIPAAKRAGYDRSVACDAARHAPIPPGHEASNGVAGMPGLGDVSRMRDCPPLMQ